MPVPKRKGKEREAPKMSRTLSGLTENRLGSGGLKFGGAVKTISSVSEVALTALRRPETDRKNDGCETFITPAITVWKKKSRVLVDENQNRIQSLLITKQLQLGGYMGSWLHILGPLVNTGFILITHCPGPGRYRYHTDGIYSNLTSPTLGWPSKRRLLLFTRYLLFSFKRKNK